MIFLTGASGVVGRAIAAQLGPHRVLGLIHSDVDVREVEKTVLGDVSQPRLGLASARWNRLAAETDVIVHSAALTEWGQPWERYEAANIGGTYQVIELAERACAPVFFISTCFVHALERGCEADVAADNVVKPYIRSKLRAEQLLAESAVPYSIFRPTNLVGDSRTGASHRPQIVQAMSDWICRGKAPYFPVHPGNRVDVVPLDILAIAVSHAVESRDVGQVYWVTYGSNAMTPQDALEILVDHAAAHGREIERAPLIDPRGPLPVSLEQVSPRSRSFLKVLIDVSEVTHACGGVLPSSMPLLQERFGVSVPSDADAYRRSLEFWAADRARARVAIGQSQS